MFSFELLSVFSVQSGGYDLTAVATKKPSIRPPFIDLASRLPSGNNKAQTVVCTVMRTNWQRRKMRRLRRSCLRPGRVHPRRMSAFVHHFPLLSVTLESPKIVVFRQPLCSPTPFRRHLGTAPTVKPTTLLTPPTHATGADSADAADGGDATIATPAGALARPV